MTFAALRIVGYLLELPSLGLGSFGSSMVATFRSLELRAQLPALKPPHKVLLNFAAEAEVLAGSVGTIKIGLASGVSPPLLRLGSGLA